MTERQENRRTRRRARWNETSQADASINKTVPEVWIAIMNLVSVQRIKSTEATWHTPWISQRGVWVPAR